MRDVFPGTLYLESQSGFGGACWGSPQPNCVSVIDLPQVWLPTEKCSCSFLGAHFKDITSCLFSGYANPTMWNSLPSELDGLDLSVPSVGDSAYSFYRHRKTFYCQSWAIKVCYLEGAVYKSSECRPIMSVEN